MYLLTLLIHKVYVCNLYWYTISLCDVINVLGDHFVRNNDRHVGTVDNNDINYLMYLNSMCNIYTYIYICIYK